LARNANIGIRIRSINRSNEFAHAIATSRSNRHKPEGDGVDGGGGAAPMQYQNIKKAYPSFRFFQRAAKNEQKAHRPVDLASGLCGVADDGTDGTVAAAVAPPLPPVWQSNARKQAKLIGEKPLHRGKKNFD
jgi:hypothetical protein